MRIGVFGAGEQRWPSLERTRQFYFRALSEHELVPLAEWPSPAAQFELDAVLNFSGRTGWEPPRHPPCPLVYALHGGPVLDHQFLRGQLGRLSRGDVLIVNCSSDVSILASMVEGDGPATCLLPLPVNSTAFVPLPPTECRALFSFRADLVVGYVARLLPQKNLHQFLVLLADVRERLRPLSVYGLVVGDYWVDYPVLPYETANYPEYVAHLVSALKLDDAVTFLPAGLSDDLLGRCYAGMDILYHPTNSLDENFGYAPIEAMACGTPVVGTAYGGLKDTVVGGVTGELIPTWVTPNGIRADWMWGADAVTNLLRNPDLRARMSIAAAERARSRYSFQSCADTLVRSLSTAVRTWKERADRPVQTVPLQPQASVGGLPALDRGWEYYEPVARHYVSGPPPTVRLGSVVRVAAPLVVSAGSARLDDPAWPAAYQMDELGLRIAERCREPVVVQTLLKDLEVSPGDGLVATRRLVVDGLLICTR